MTYVNNFVPCAGNNIFVCAYILKTQILCFVNVNFCLFVCLFFFFRFVKLTVFHFLRNHFYQLGFWGFLGMIFFSFSFLFKMSFSAFNLISAYRETLNMKFSNYYMLFSTPVFTMFKPKLLTSFKMRVKLFTIALIN